MSRRGVTLIELLIALAITMIMMGAVVTLFANMTTTVTDSRAVIDMTDKLRTARDTLQNDLAGHTAPTLPPLDPGKDLGFLELIEGQTFYDCGQATYMGVAQGLVLTPYTAASQNSILGDVDDIAHLTVRSNGKPFVGRMGLNGGNPNMMESQTAEVIWFALPNGRLLTNKDGTTTQLYTLYRRQLLVLPGYNLQGAGNVPGLYTNYDISARNDLVTGQTVANTLGDLTKRENRYYHGVVGNNPPANYPFALNITPAAMQNLILTGSRLGEDVILDNVLAFDIRVFDPLAIAFPGADGTMLTPSDPGYPTVPTLATKIAAQGGLKGCYVDMGYMQASRAAISWSGTSYFAFSAGGLAYCGLTWTPASYPFAFYDTWSSHYEQNGYDEDKNGTVDQGMNGFDDPSPYTFTNPGAVNGIVDDPPSFDPTMVKTPLPGERETLAPFPFPLRAMKAIIRVYEPDSRQIRQVTVVQDFVPE